MKRILTLLIVLFSLNASAQTDTVTNYTDSLVYRIDTVIIAGDDTITSDSSFVRWNYTLINIDSIYEDQLVILDSSGKVLAPIQALMDQGCSSSGTVYRKKLTATEIGWTPKQRLDSLWLPLLKTIDSNIIKL